MPNYKTIPDSSQFYSKFVLILLIFTISQMPAVEKLIARPRIAPVKRSVRYPVFVVKNSSTVARPKTLAPIKQVHKPAKRAAVIKEKPYHTKQPTQLQRKKRERYTELAKYIEPIKKLKGIGNGRILVIVACGPSVSEIDLTRLNNHKMIDLMTVNKPNLSLWPTRFWAFCDQSQYNRNREAWTTYKGTIINSVAVRARRSSQIIIRNKGGPGFSRDLTSGFHIGRSTVYANMQTALWMGYSRVYIFGVDMCSINGKTWFYGVNPDVKEQIRVSRFPKEASNYDVAAEKLTPDERKRFFFCSSYNTFPFVKRFNKRDHKTVVPEILQYANELAGKI